MLLARSCVRIFKLYSLSQPAMHQPRCQQPPFCFPKGGAKTQVFHLFLAWGFGSSFCACSLAICQSSVTASIADVHWELSTGCGCLWVRCSEHWKNHSFPWLKIIAFLWVSCFQRLLGKLLDGVCDVVSRICIPLMPTRSPICPSPSHFLLPSHESHDSILWMW